MKEKIKKISFTDKNNDFEFYTYKTKWARLSEKDEKFKIEYGDNENKIKDFKIETFDNLEEAEQFIRKFLTNR